ncbi:hypothetical protein C5167_005458 [Papaver somniferum]|uniref:Uncharacterized protein n=1 Tax=Papaver somniferum TaxID=3469 RepID=A0A4Y7JEI8_PAPSO|nr:hypothetical protein C5167_005458 [Papaver somniferum]
MATAGRFNEAMDEPVILRKKANVKEMGKGLVLSVSPEVQVRCYWMVSPFYSSRDFHNDILLSYATQ